MTLAFYGTGPWIRTEAPTAHWRMRRRNLPPGLICDAHRLAEQNLAA
jgi:hypothetical protein